MIHNQIRLPDPEAGHPAQQLADQHLVSEGGQAMLEVVSAPHVHLYTYHDLTIRLSIYGISFLNNMIPLRTCVYMYYTSRDT